MGPRVRRALMVGLCSLLACVLVAAPAPAESSPPDQVDPPAPGEGQPLQDPSDPPPPAYTAQGSPSGSVWLSGRSWDRPRVEKLRGTSRYASVVSASKVGWPNGARRVVLVHGIWE